MANKFRQMVEAPNAFFQSLNNLVPWLSKLWRTLGQVEEWHEVGSSGEPAFENSWVNYGGSNEPTSAFYKDPFGIVRIKGLVKAGTVGTVIFTLPVGYRPTKYTYASTYSNGAFGGLVITPSGGVRADVGSNVWFAINCSFRI